jgi:hypothetical protein
MATARSCSWSAASRLRAPAGLGTDAICMAGRGGYRGTGGTSCALGTSPTRSSAG